jgi:hypothetical protein
MPRSVPPLHRRAAAEAALGRSGGRFRAHGRTVACEEDGYDAPAGALAEWLGTGLQNPVHRFDSGRRLSRQLSKIRAICRAFVRA